MDRCATSGICTQWPTPDLQRPLRVDIPEEVFAGRPHRVSMGLRPLDLTTWLDVDSQHPQRVLREELLVQRRDDVFAVAPGGEAAATAVAKAVATWCGRRLPGRDHPLVEAATLVREDLCVLQRLEAAWRLVAAVVCFPSRWLLADKMGQDVVSIHDPVPGYRQQLGTPTGRVFDTLSPRWRINWTLLDDPALFQPRMATPPSAPPDESWYLRVERQCLVPIGDYVAFTIRTDVVALADLGAPERTAVLQSAASAPVDLATYRGWVSR